MEGGWTDSAGIRRSRWASTAMRSSSKKAGSFIGMKRFLSAELRKSYALLSPSRSKGSAASLPSAFFSSISTRASAFSEQFDSRYFLSEILLLTVQIAVRGASTLCNALDGPPMAAARQSFALVGAQEFFESPEPPLRITKEARRVQTAF